VEVLERGPQQVRIRAVRDWGKVNIVTVYSLRATPIRSRSAPP